jgi:endonuclease/exonuclease/phosphatase family metal-dependent hydrolase
MKTCDTGCKLATWNLHRCIGRDGVMSPERCAAVLKEIDADVMALQEVEYRPGHELDVLAYLARETGYRTIAGVTMVREGAHYGNALLTRLQVGDVRRHDLSVRGSEPRAMMLRRSGVDNVAHDRSSLHISEGAVSTVLTILGAVRLNP